MRTLLISAMLLLAACAATAPEGPSTDTGTIVGEVGDPRNRARAHTELAAAYFQRGNRSSPRGAAHRAARTGLSPAHSMWAGLHVAA